MTHTPTSRNRISAAMETLYGTAQRFKAIQEAILQGMPLCLKDYGFYRRHCKKNGIVPMSTVIDKKSGMAIAFNKPLMDDNRAAGLYKSLIGCLDSGNRITVADYRFLTRYCRQTGKVLPRVRYEVLVYKADIHHENN